MAPTRKTNQGHLGTSIESSPSMSRSEDFENCLWCAPCKETKHIDDEFNGLSPICASLFGYRYVSKKCHNNHKSAQTTCWLYPSGCSLVCWLNIGVMTWDWVITKKVKNRLIIVDKTPDCLFKSPVFIPISANYLPMCMTVSWPKILPTHAECLQPKYPATDQQTAKKTGIMQTFGR